MFKENVFKKKVFQERVFPACCLSQHSNLALGRALELPSPAPLRCGEAKGDPDGWPGCGPEHQHMKLTGLDIASPLQPAQGA